jgi:hypothetical protein
MTSRPGFIDFFVLEATEYVEQLDGLMKDANAGAPDGEAMQRTGRALRGVATMAKLTPLAELAAAVERIARATRERLVEWSPALRAAMVSTVDDFRILVRDARTWGDPEAKRAAERTRELAAFAPAPAGADPTPAADAPPAYLVGEANNIAAGLELLATRPDNRAAAAAVLGRVRALRGVAGIKDLPPLGEVAEAAENAAKPLELGEPRLSADQVAVLQAAAVVLRRIAVAIRDGNPTNAPSAEYDRFVAAMNALQDSANDGADIVSVASFFYDDSGPKIVTRAPEPPTTPNERFRSEAVHLAEHLKALVSLARATSDSQARELVGRDLRRGLRAIRTAAESYGEQSVIGLLASYANVADTVDDRSLSTVERIIQTVAYPDAPVSPSAPTPIVSMPAIRRTPGVGVPAVRPRNTPVTGAAPAPPRSTPTIGMVATPPRSTPAMGMRATPPGVVATPPRSTPPVAGVSLGGGSSLDEGIAALDALAAAPFAEPRPLDDTPIEALVYSGRSAVERAIKLRERIRRSSGAASPEEMGELFDLLDLALAE